jgi:hypothetical protein
MAVGKQSWTLGLGAPAAVIATVLLAACAGNPAKDLVPGRSTRAEVEQQMGAPKLKLDAAAGETLWFYPRPTLRQTYAVRIGKDGVVRAVEERLTPEYINQIKVARSGHDEVRALLGPPRSVTRDRRQAREIWEFDIWGRSGNAAVLWVQFSDDGKVREFFERELPRATTMSA